MSRIGQAIIKIPDGIEVKHEGNNFWAKGSKGELTAPVSSSVNVIIKDGMISVEPKKNTPCNPLSIDEAAWLIVSSIFNE